MEYQNRLKQFEPTAHNIQVDALVGKARQAAKTNLNAEVCKKCIGALDITTLGITDSEESVTELVNRTIALKFAYPGVPLPASVCVFPNFVETVGIAAGDTGIRIASVAGGFPTSQTYLEVKMLEAAMAVENGADEVDIVMNLGEFLGGEYDVAANEIEILRQEVGEDITLKVIIEAGMLPGPQEVRQASLLAMLAGADFVKTSTGKASVSATPETAAQICLAIRDFNAATGRKVGFKVAGGVRTAEDAVLYYSIVETVLGREWLTPQLFRIGASSLADDLLSHVTGRAVNYFGINN